MPKYALFHKERQVSFTSETKCEVMATACWKMPEIFNLSEVNVGTAVYVLKEDWEVREVGENA